MLGETTLGHSFASRIAHIQVQSDLLVVYLEDGRAIATPLAWYPRLLDATPEQRMAFEISAGGFGVHWPDLDEDLSVDGMLRGAKAPRHRRELPSGVEDPVVTRVRFEARRWVHSFATTNPSDRFPMKDFGEFVAQHVSGALSPDVRAVAIQAAHSAAMETWRQMHGIPG